MRRQCCCTPSEWAAAPAAGAATLGRHLAGGRRCLTQGLPLLATTLASGHPCRRQPWPRGCPFRPCNW
ncbi:hypothetical protein GW17_00052254 [Ensete ventricosum]|nr:hypothetical protein GW17_00052254 [Ensete ventricosum]